MLATENTMPTIDKLTNKFLQADKHLPNKGQRDYFEKNGRGFGVQASYGGTRSFFIMGRVGGKKVRVTLKPPYDPAGKKGLSLKEAHEKAEPIIKQFAAGDDPRMVRQQERAEEVKQRADTYGKAVEDFIEKFHQSKKKNRTSKESMRLLLWPRGGKPPGRDTEIDVDGHQWRDRPVSEITKRNIVDLLDTIMKDDKGYTANRVYAAMNTFFKWCVSRDKIPTSPMKDVERPFDGERARDRVFDEKEIKALWGAADELGRYPGAFLKMLMLTGKRRSAALAMRWDEISDDWIWTPSADKQSRTKRTFKTPLPPLAVQILKGLTPVKGNPFVFVGRGDGKHLDAGSPLQGRVKKESGVEDFLFHAIRHTVETKLAEGWKIDGEMYRVPPHIRDLVLDHVPLRGSGAGYDHYDYADEIRETLEAWADRLEHIAMPVGVRALR